MTITTNILQTLPPPHISLRPKQPKLSVVGAGPGDPELLTIKALNAIKQADVVLYDALANTEILSYCKPEALAVYVGKRKGTPSITQDEINQLIVRHACTFGHVVRLKGGDPFVFGRGFEEMLYAEKCGIPSEYIPGISSAIGVAGLEHIPLTHRGTSESFWVITGATAEGDYSRDLHAAAQTNATVVVLMGLGALPAIVEVFTQHGKAHLPVAVIQSGSLPYSQIVTGTVADIVYLVHKAGVQPPGIIVLGEVVGLRSVLSSRFHASASANNF
ncbi:MAG: uroporphyrinogen-III C-methyltransferase [Candidatus Kapaibacteriota bacterium]